eukprot:TRINITY_DN18402_c0_g1_i1.p1 TRINITY_DN18402_c0_g1~~TRINITY_DN18402_c0_g1_i1.p1  ORF type:complete len:134 (+),score=20.75 TRINITY_DN18402_c0_g1_i1:200-601(+)
MWGRLRPTTTLLRLGSRGLPTVSSSAGSSTAADVLSLGARSLRPELLWRQAAHDVDASNLSLLLPTLLLRMPCSSLKPEYVEEALQRSHTGAAHEISDGRATAPLGLECKGKRHKGGYGHRTARGGMKGRRSK